MENLENAYIKSLLSKVAYEYGIDVGYNFNFLGIGFSDAEREYLKENYKVIGTKHTESGLDLVIFKNLVTGENTISIAGTKLPSMADWGNDISLGATGIAHKQFIELYNYYQQITHAYGESILQIKKLENPSYEPEKPYLRIETAEDEYTYYLIETVENNELSINEFGAINTNNLSFTGHSLGGHLAGIMSIVTGKEATIFNAPSYKENTTLSSGCEYVKADGNIEETTSDFDALICKLLNINNPDSKEGNITHYQNNYGGGFSESIAGSWNNTEKIYCLSGDTNWLNEHSINEIHSTLYAYYVIKDIATGIGSFFNNSSLTTSSETFENVYKSYCLNKGKTYQVLDYSNHTNINQIISNINDWIETQKTNGGAIKVDSFNHSTSLPMTGTDGDDIIYTGGGNDTVNSGKGNDTVYGIDLNGDQDFSANSTKNINLGAGNDNYYGSNAKDKVTTTGTNTQNDTNYIYLGAGDDEFHGGDGIDIVDGGSGATGGLRGISSQNMTDSDTAMNEIHLGGGNDIYTGGIGTDEVWSGSGDDIINTGAGKDIVYTNDNADKNDINRISLGAGGDEFHGGVGKDIVDGGVSEDVETDENIIHLGEGDDEYRGGVGIDKVWSGSGDDTIRTGAGNDKVYTTDGSSNDVNKVYLGAGSDYFEGGSGRDIVYGGYEDAATDVNTIKLGGGKDEYYGGDGIDIVHGGSGNDIIDGGDGINELYGDDGNDYIYGGSDKDKLYGGNNNDHLFGYEGNDELYGGTGIDYLYPGTGINKIDCGVDNNSDFVCIQNNAGGIDTIYHVNARDRLSCAGGFNISTLTQVGRDVVLYGNRGNKIVLKNVKLDDDGDPNGRIPCDSMPALYQPDVNNILEDGFGNIHFGKITTVFDETALVA